MTDDTKPNEEAGTWQMPEPTFQTTEGRAPGSPKSEAVTDEMEIPGDDLPGTPPAEDISTAVTEEIPMMPNSPVKSGGFGSLILILLIITVLAGGIVAALYYILSAKPVDTTF